MDYITPAATGQPAVTFAAPGLYIRLAEAPALNASECRLILTMSWETAEIIRHSIAPFLHHLCAAVDTRTKQQAERDERWQREETRWKEQERVKRVALFGIVRRFYRAGMTESDFIDCCNSPEWKAAGVNPPARHFTWVRARAIYWHHKRGKTADNLAAMYGVKKAVVYYCLRRARDW